MAAEFYIVFDDPAWHSKSQTVIRSFIHTLETFRNNIDDQEYWMRGNEAGGDWAYGARIFMRPRDILLEISSHRPSIVNDIQKLNRFISENTQTQVIDDDGEGIEGYS